MDELTGAIDVRVEVWVDGSCRGNPGPGGYAALSQPDQASAISVSVRLAGTLEHNLS